MSTAPWPQHTLQNCRGQTVAVSPSLAFAPAHASLPVLTVDEMRRAMHPGWCVMQKDDGMSPAFVLYQGEPS